MSVREQLNQLTASLPDYKLAYVLAYVQGLIAGGEADESETPNAETLEAFEELDNGGGHTYNGAVENLIGSLLEDESA